MKEVEFPAMTVKQLANRWGVSCKTVREWLKPFEEDIGPRIGKMYSPHQVKIILSRLE